MPEFGGLEKNLINKVAKNNPNYDQEEKPNVIKLGQEPLGSLIMNEVSLKKIGEGAESFVISHKQENKVVAVEKSVKDPIHMKEKYYFNNILNTLFPENFPKIYSSFTKSDDENKLKVSATVRQRIYPKNADLHDENASNSKLFSKVKMALEKMGLPVLLDEKSSTNFITDSKGNEYYVDNAIIASSLSSFEKLKKGILGFMTENKYSSSDIKKVLNSLERLAELKKQQ